MGTSIRSDAPLRSRYSRGRNSIDIGGTRPSTSRGSTSVLSIARSTVSSQSVEPLLLASLRPTMVPSGATRTSTVASGLPSTRGEHDVRLDARLDPAGVARRGTGRPRRVAGGRRVGAVAGLAHHAAQVRLADRRLARLVLARLLGQPASSPPAPRRARWRSRSASRGASPRSRFFGFGLARRFGRARLLLRAPRAFGAASAFSIAICASARAAARAGSAPAAAAALGFGSAAAGGGVGSGGATARGAAICGTADQSSATTPSGSLASS